MTNTILYILLVVFLILGITSFIKYLKLGKKTIAAVISILTLALIGSIVAYLMYNKPHKDVAGTPSDFQISAAELYKAFNEDEAAANTKYLEKIIEVQGIIVGDLNTDNPAEPSLFLETGDDFGVVSCGFPQSQTEELSQLKSGTTVKVKGLCKGKTMDVVLTNCTIIE